MTSRTLCQQLNTPRDIPYVAHITQNLAFLWKDIKKINYLFVQKYGSRIHYKILDLVISYICVHACNYIICSLSQKRTLELQIVRIYVYLCGRMTIYNATS